MGQVMLIWIAFALLPWSEEKGRTKLKGHIQVDPGQHGRTSQTAGGLLWVFMVYDIFCFFMCSAVVGYAIATRPDNYDDWVVRGALFGMQIIYGYLSFPFFFFTLPFLQAVLTHAVPT